MLRKIKIILRDYQIWLAIATTIALSADAVAESGVSLFRGLSIAAILALIVARVINLMKLHTRKHVPVVAVIGKPDEQYRDTLGQIETAMETHDLPIAQLEKAFNLYHEDWVYHRESPLPEENHIWMQELSKLQRKFWRLAERIPGRKVYHFFLNGPAAYAVGMGALFGSRSIYVFYQYVAASAWNAYEPAIDFRSLDDRLGPHILKSNVTKYRHINVAGVDKIPNDYKGEALLAIYLAGHDPRDIVAEIGRQQAHPVITIDSIYRGTIPLDADWIRIAREISQAALRLVADSRIKRVHLYLSTPLALAFALGSALGPFVQVSVHNYFPKTDSYQEVLRLEEL